VEIEFKTAKLKKTCESYELARKKWGDKRARAIIKRLNEIQSAECIADLNHAPPTRCHLLEPHKRGIYAVDVEHPFRLLFLAISEDGEPLGNFDSAQVRCVKILEVTDYHD
jgi:plasmid maintenance system killer protein